METWKKTGNIIGIVFAWLLSIVLVFMLIAAPLALSALSLLNTEDILETLTDTLTQSLMPQGDESAADYSITRLSETTEDNAADTSEEMGMDILSGFLGDQVSQETLNKVLSSNAAKELLKAYTDDLTNAFTDGNQEGKFNAELIKKIVDENIDEIVEIVKEVSPEGTQINVEEIKSQITSAVNENAEQIVQAFPKPEEIKEQVMEATPELEMAFQVFANKNKIKGAIIGVIVVLCALIFVCRIPGFRGLRWLATDLFIGSGFGMIICAGFSIIGSALKSSIGQNPQFGGIIDAFYGKLTTGLMVRTAVMLVSAVILLVAYIFIKKALAKKAAEETVEEEAVEALPEAEEAEETAEVVEAE